MLTYSAPDPFEPGDEEAWKELCLPLLWMLSDKELEAALQRAEQAGNEDERRLFRQAIQERGGQR